jgi:hypothetical protein
MMNRQMPQSLRLWIASFVILSAAGFVTQFGVLPYLTPSLHGGDGLIANTDSVTFHRTAERIASAINEDGWSHWQLRPEAWGHVGISSAIYAVTIPKPWVLVPVAAALMALTLLMLTQVLRLAGLSPDIAYRAVLVLLILPSTLMLTVQWHKDQIAISSTIAMILGFLLLWRGARVLGGAIAILAGTFGLWMVRDHIIEVMAGAALVGTLAVALTVRWRVPADVRGLTRIFVGLIGITLLSQTLPSWTDRHEVSQAQWKEWNARTVHGEMNDAERAAKEMRRAATMGQVATTEDRPYDDVVLASWYPSPWLPSWIDQRIASFAQIREASKRGTGHGCASIDTEVTFNNVASVLSYTPRSITLVLLAPFPRTWAATACSGGGRVLSLVSAAEMAIAYAAFAGIPLLLWQFRRQSSLWFVVALCMGALIVHGLIFVNIGTLFRIRYAWFATLVVLGAAGWATQWASRARAAR